MKNFLLMGVLVFSGLGLFAVHERHVAMANQEMVENTQKQLAAMNVTLAQMEANQMKSMALQTTEVSALIDSQKLQMLQDQLQLFR